MSAPSYSRPVAFTFDIFGTVVDWRGTLALKANVMGLNGAEFARRWAWKYVEFIRSGRPWEPLSDVLKRVGAETLREFGITVYNPAVLDSWERLLPWLDSPEGLRRLSRRGYVVALSNADGPMVHRLSDFAKLSWDVVLGNERFRVYKPNVGVYRGAATELGIEPGHIMMVAAHLFDLRAAKAEGYQTAFIRRPGEESELATPDVMPNLDFVDIVANDLIDLDAKLAERQ